ncbi:MAG: hypothetical protein ABEK03_10870 [Candidatus Bipolaricaulia bacterium]
MTDQRSGRGRGLKVGTAMLALIVGGFLGLAHAGFPFEQTVLGRNAAIGVQVSASGEAVCGAKTSHRVTAEWSVSDAKNPNVSITLVLPDGRTITQSRNAASGQVSFDLTLEGGGTLRVEIEASSGGGTASASTTVTVSPCEREGFDPEEKWSGRETEDPDFNAPPVGTDGKPLGKQVQAQGATNIVGAQYEENQLDFQVRGSPGQQQQYGINQDCDKDGVGESWTWILPGENRAVETGPDLVVNHDVPVQRQGQGFQVQMRADDCALIVASFQRQQSQTQQAGKLGPDQEHGTVQVGEQVEQIALNTTAQAIMVEGVQRQRQRQSGGQGQQQRQQQSLKDKFCPAQNRGTRDDVNGDGIADIFYPANVREFENVKIEVWCVSNNTFAKRVTHSDGTQGWVGKCPYIGGQNRQTVIDQDGDGQPDVIRRTIVDGGSDDDGDGRTDAMVYEYDINTREHTATLYEDGQQVRSRTHQGPYSSVGALPFFRN